ncbi:MAG: hypothetical protein JWP89_2966 [Schlesneria sp.]|nr:hypothetical protein [Schlesneria sp.]
MGLDFVSATKNYETWLRSQVAVVEKELHYKHRQMALKETAFPFFRGTYYRWAEIWPMACQDCAVAPTVLSIGDLHVENFGTWRDLEGRLVWGINDFDEAEDLPFTNDLVRLAASALLGSVTGQFRLNLPTICQAILSGYATKLKVGGQPFVLEEGHPELRALAMQSDREPGKFWKKFRKELSDREPKISKATKARMLSDLPDTNKDCRFRARFKAGMGSLGKPRYVALTTFKGSLVAREAKALTPPSTSCLEEGSKKKSRIEDVLKTAIRCADPIYRVDGPWIVRRLAPRCSKIELAQLDCVSERLMFESMGAECANIHLGTAGASKSILKWLRQQHRDWLVTAAATISDLVHEDWRCWRKHDKSSIRDK